MQHRIATFLVAAVLAAGCKEKSSADLAKDASPSTEVMALVKSDIEASLANFGDDYSFRNAKSFWSKPATLMLKAEVFLWTSYRGGGANDAGIAKTALADVQANAPGLSLQSQFADVFRVGNRGNSEIIFAVRYLRRNLWPRDPFDLAEPSPPRQKAMTPTKQLRLSGGGN